jgi:hypothetical protein
VESREENKMIEYAGYALLIAIVWGVHSVWRLDCTDGRKTGRRAISDPKFVKKSTLPSIGIIFIFLMLFAPFF